MAELLFWLVVGHCVADYPLQGDFLSRAKNATNPIPGVPFWHALFAHAAIHAGVVMAATGSLMCALMELVLHAAIDDAKCRGYLTFNQDQGMHLLCKIAYVAILATHGGING